MTATTLISFVARVFSINRWITFSPFQEQIPPRAQRTSSEANGKSTEIHVATLSIVLISFSNR